MTVNAGLDSAGGAGLRSAVEGILWPAIPIDAGAHLLAINLQLGQSQWWEPETMRRHQLGQLRALVNHAVEQVPFYRGGDYRRWPALPAEEAWAAFSALPILTRRQVQESGAALFASSLPREHGSVSEDETSGSTGVPLRYRTSKLAGFFWSAFVLREHFWHGRDFAARHAFIRSRSAVPLGPTWGSPASEVFRCGEAANLPIGRPMHEKVTWLRGLDPHYLMTTPSTLRALAESTLVGALPLPRLRQARTVGETVTAALRELVRRAWGVGVVDTYSLSECGPIAFQCPAGEHYHVQSEWALVEILDEDGHSCPPGGVGRVVVTPLHNFAMPLLRYDTGDYAEAGERCPCGRGLESLERILGRRRNRLILPGGDVVWPNFSSLPWTRIAPALRRFQLRQRSDYSLLLRYEAERALTPEEQAAVAEAMGGQMGRVLPLEYERADDLPLSPAGKLEDFISELDADEGRTS